MTDLATLITAIVGLLALIGAGFKFIWTKVEVRFLKIEADLKECHAKHVVSLDRRAKQLTVIELLWGELARIAPKSRVFTRVKKLLDELKPDEGGV